MGKNFKASSKLTAKFLVVMLVLQAVLFAFAASADTLATAVVINKGTSTAVSPVIAFLGTNVILTASLTGSPTTATYKANTWTSSTAAATLTTPTGGATTTVVPVAKGTTTITVTNTA